MAYLTQVKSKNIIYIYLQVQDYTPEEETSKKRRNIFSFGRKEQTLKLLQEWNKEFAAKFPMELRELGFGKVDLEEWIKTLETGVTKTGRSKKFKVS